MCFEDTNRWSWLDVPTAHRAVSWSSHEQLGFSVDAQACNRSRVSGEDLQGTTSLERPGTSSAVGRSADQDVVKLHKRCGRRRPRRTSRSRTVLTYHKNHPLVLELEIIMSQVQRMSPERLNLMLFSVLLYFKNRYRSNLCSVKTGDWLRLKSLVPNRPLSSCTTRTTGSCCVVLRPVRFTDKVDISDGPQCPPVLLDSRRLRWIRPRRHRMGCTSVETHCLNDRRTLEYSRKPIRAVRLGRY